MDDLTYGSICTGYDGISLGLRIAGLPIRPLWHAENEPSVAQVLKREQPDVPNIGDVKLAPWFLAPHVLSRPDALKAAGNGCVPLAVAAAYQLLARG